MKDTITRVDALNYAIKTISETECYGDEVARHEEIVMILNKMRDGIAKPRKTSDKAKAKAKAKRADARGKMLAEVLPVLRVALTGADSFTAKELYDRCADQLPADFTEKKVQYILLHDLAEEVIKTETKGKANTYRIEG